MASARRTIPPTPPRPPAEVTLTLSEVEARTLVAVLRRVGGHATASPRQHATAILVAMRDVVPGSRDLGAPGVPEVALVEGSLYFENYR